MSSNAGPSGKRRRTEDRNGDGTPNPLVSEVRRDEEVWLSDRNIVVVATKKVAFRVHKSILSLRSEVFRDLFSLPGADAATAEMMDGCPVVHVSDLPDDIQRLFLVLCCGKNYYYNRGELIPVKFGVLASLVRMGHKYVIQDVLDDALFRLKKYYGYTWNFDEWKDSDARADYVTTTEEDAPTVIELARLTNTPQLLPTAFFTCAKLMSRGFTGGNGSLVSAFTSLSVADQIVLIEAMRYLTQLYSTRPLQFLASVPSGRCTARETCLVTKDLPLIAMRNYGYILIPPVCGEDPLEPGARRFWGPLWKNFCGNCQEDLLETDKRAMELLWDTLPRLFHVNIVPDDWETGTEGTDGE